MFSFTINCDQCFVSVRSGIWRFRGSQFSWHPMLKRRTGSWGDVCASSSRDPEKNAKSWFPLKRSNFSPFDVFVWVKIIYVVSWCYSSWFVAGNPHFKVWNPSLSCACYCPYYVLPDHKHQANLGGHGFVFLLLSDYQLKWASRT